MLFPLLRSLTLGLSSSLNHTVCSSGAGCEAPVFISSIRPVLSSAGFLAGPQESPSLPLLDLLDCSFTQDMHLVPPSLPLAFCPNVSPAGNTSIITPHALSSMRHAHTHTHTYLLSLSVHLHITFKKERISFSFGLYL